MYNNQKKCRESHTTKDFQLIQPKDQVIAYGLIDSYIWYICNRIINITHSSMGFMQYAV